MVVPVNPPPPSPPLNVQGLLFTPDATYDIGASGASRPNNLWLAGNETAGGTISAAGNISSNASLSAIGTVTGASFILSSAGGALRGGSGAPGAGLGNNGDYFFRTDTPGTSLQRIYVKSAGAWVGIV